MLCPQCGAEYREGFFQCSDCQVALVDKLPVHTPPPRILPPQLVTILETGDPFLLGVAKSLLDSAGIPYLAKGEALQDLFAVGRMGTGFNPIAGPVELQIAPEDEEQARDLLARLDGRDLDY